MYQEHPDFELPKDSSTKIWKYMDLAKFLSLLESSSLYFVRADTFADPYEGTIPTITAENIAGSFQKFQNAAEMGKTLLHLFDMNRNLCW